MIDVVKIGERIAHAVHRRRARLRNGHAGERGGIQQRIALLQRERARGL